MRYTCLVLRHTGCYLCRERPFFARKPCKARNMQIDIPAQDLLSIYFLCYSAVHSAPPAPEMEDTKQMMQSSIAKLREQLAAVYPDEITQMEMDAELILAHTHAPAQGWAN